jgi:hypothetical protein
VALARTNVLEECTDPIILISISMLGTTLAVTSNQSTVQRNTNYMRKEALRGDTRGRVISRLVLWVGWKSWIKSLNGICEVWNLKHYIKPPSARCVNISQYSLYLISKSIIYAHWRQVHLHTLLLVLPAG